MKSHANSLVAKGKRARKPGKKMLRAYFPPGSYRDKLAHLQIVVSWVARMQEFLRPFTNLCLIHPFHTRSTLRSLNVSLGL
jgi:hypothetical protein